MNIQESKIKISAKSYFFTAVNYLTVIKLALKYSQLSTKLLSTCIMQDL